MIVSALFRFILWLMGWKTKGHRPDGLKKSVVIIAPHTSNWDFPILAMAKNLVGLRDVKFLAKKSLFTGPFGWFFYWMGGTPVDRDKRNSLVSQVVDKFNSGEINSVAITPEATRSYVEDWRSGFYHIARQANVPIFCAFVDYDRRRVGVDKIFYPTDDYASDLKELKEFYEDKAPLHYKLTPHFLYKKPPFWRWFYPLVVFSRLLLVFVIGFTLLNWSLVQYGVRQGIGQAKVVWQAKPLAYFLENPEYPDSLKVKIRIIQEIKAFAEDSLGLDPSGSYRKMYDQQGKPLLWVVTACKPFAFEEKEWEFPILGKVSYKGFFEQSLAEKEELSLQMAGYDTRIGEVNAWSTLGILNDPILSNMLYRPEGSLANLIIHELTHGTLFIADNIAYNENLASFVGDVGAEMYLKSRYGEDANAYLQYVRRKEDRHTFSNYILEGANRLEALYQSFPDTLPVESKMLAKRQLIEEIIGGVQDLKLHTTGYKNYFNGFAPNNTFFMGFRRYRQRQNEFRKEFEEVFNSDFKAYMQYLKEKYPSIF